MGGRTKQGAEAGRKEASIAPHALFPAHQSKVGSGFSSADLVGLVWQVRGHLTLPSTATLANTDRPGKQELAQMPRLAVSSPRSR